MELQALKALAELGVMVMISVAFVYLVFKVGVPLVSSFQDLVSEVKKLTENTGETRKELREVKEVLGEVKKLLKNFEGLLERKGITFRSEES